jgi:hypothetical protein
MSSTAYPDLFAALAAPFTGQNEVKTRKQAGRDLSYVTARTVMNRLDAVLGPENWWNRYAAGGDHSVVCALTIRLPDGSTVTKCDAGGCAGMSDAGDDDKSGYSDAFKRAAVMFGVARYLYRDGVPSYHGQDTPARETPVPEPANGKPRSDWARDRRETDSDPRSAPLTGRALFAWGREHEALRALTAYGQEHQFPARIVDWDSVQVAEAFDALRAAMEG